MRAELNSSNVERLNRCNSSTIQLFSVVIQRSPEIPSGYGAIRSPFFAVLHQLFRRGKFSFTKSFGETLLHSVIGNWPDIRAAKIKEQKHLDGPATYTADLCKTRDDFLVAHLDNRASGWNRAVNRFRREIFYCRSFGAR